MTFGIRVWPRAFLALLGFLLCNTATTFAGSDPLRLSKPHILLTGEPGVGKTTVVKKVLETLPCSLSGAYAEEELMDGERVGFVIYTLDGKKGYLAHVDFESPHCVGSFGVDIEAIENLVIPALGSTNSVIIIDEIGLMQCCAPGFLEAVTGALNSGSCVFGTISSQNTEGLLAIKNREDVQIIEVTPENRDTLPQAIAEYIYQSLVMLGVRRDL